jgi:hypothetical protein
MKSIHCRRLSLMALMIGVVGLLIPATSNAQKLSAEEIIAKHLEAIGPAETRNSVTSRIFSGTVVVTFREPSTGQLGGRVVLASVDTKNMLAMVFDNSTNYPHEKVGYDGSEVSSSYLRPGARSTLGDFLITHKTVIKNGLIGGELSQAWPLIDLAGRKAKVETAGTKKIGDRQTYQLKFSPSGGSDLRISLFFDAETFHHVRTEYNRTVASQIGATPELSSRQSETRYKMVEDFSDFRKAGGLTLPHNYRILLELTSQRGQFKAEWEMTFLQFEYNQKIDVTTFDVDDLKKK